MNDPAYFDYGDKVSPGLASRVVQLFVIVVFLASTMGAGIVDTLWPIEPVKPIGEELRRENAIAARANLWDGSQARLFEKELRARSFVRDLVLPRYSLLKYMWLQEGPAGVTVGKEHWSFYDARIRLAPLPAESLAGGLVNSMVAVDRRLNGQGTQLHLLPIPRKSYVAREYLPDWSEPRHGIDDLVLDQLRDRGVNLADMREPYMAAGATEIYFKLDSHWTPRGAQLAAEALAKQAGLLRAPGKRLGKRWGRRQSFLNGFGTATLGSIGHSMTEADVYRMQLQGVRQSEVTLPRWANKLRARRKPGKFALAGTSFSADWRFELLLTHFVGYPVYDGSLAARPYMESLSEVFKTYENNEDAETLEHLFWEAPIGTALVNHNISGMTFGKAVGAAFAALPPKHTESVMQLPVDWLPTNNGDVTEFVGGGRKLVIRIPSGHLAHTGDGAAGLGVTGEIFGGPVEFLATSEGTRCLTQLEPGPFELVLPILSTHANAGQVAFTMLGSSGTSIRLDEQGLVHEFVRGTDVPVEFVRDSGPLLSAKTNLVLGRRAALVAQVQSDEERVAGITVRVRSKGNGTRREHSISSLAAQFTLVLDLGLPPGTELESIEIESEGASLSIQGARVTGTRP